MRAGSSCSEGTCALVPKFMDDANSNCTGDRTCDGVGGCQRKNGVDCADDTQCTSLHCVDRVCCNEACNGTCYSCNLAGSAGTCKPVDGGKRLLVSSSSGGCALLELPSGKALWWARVANAHSIEAVPGDRIAVAASVGTNANRIVVFDRTGGTKVVTETPLPSGHGLVWDESRKRLWALGMKELRAYSLKDWDGAKPSLELERSHPLPDDDGHDLRAIPGGPDLILTTHHGVWLFDREKATFRTHPELGKRERVKCTDPHPETGQLVVIQAAGDNWWTDKIERFSPAAPGIHLEKERLYKGRWCTEFPEAP